MEMFCSLKQCTLYSEVNIVLKTVVRGIELTFETANDLFSPRSIDCGTLALLSTIEFDELDKVCDLGCGYGAIGIIAAKIMGSENVLMIDNNSLAVEVARKNVVLNGVPNIEVVLSNGFSNIQEKDFSKIITHPPYHVDFAVPKAFIEKGFNRLKINGAFYMVTKRKTWYEKKLTAIFGNVEISMIDGYYIFKAIKRHENYAKVNHKKAKVKTPSRKKGGGAKYASRNGD